ncbi:exonuclease subunit SbcD [Pseudomonas chengduensis]|uniref:Nuclease SbcCD subunit D n=1 Tax=Ectopseudomonas chengduensis TaxID=489632 RepID=A0A1G6WAW2_9GAMM|nr:exonuclease subunit SbcD [Pseudomonas chengduensis]MBP3064211.1 exonuclease subunit SbcD [Pseudomonas chengduensis]MDH0960423.1 exonuclease subunit SbcD [Pseudomonas chengduensis]MDH1536532.1 exonuclease subunit SbcD [Pseudomonas chengduensis]NNB77313.1 exonuclease subunit SbcD [Pseudomonas chengduensis]SDD62929.1 Exodeoxyribonuclease I subunit D [Pseudomonas chengduensis]
MRILHTSDWHLGQHFMGKTRQAEHQAFCAWLLEQVRVHAVDVLLIAGDVFDTGAPPSYAREEYYRLVVELRDAGCALVVLGGNHDSPAMLGESRSLLAQLGTQVVPSVGVDLAEQVLVLNDRTGQPGAVLCAIPFIRPRDVLASQAGQSAQDKQQSLQQAIAEHYRALYELAASKRDELGLTLPIIATGHLTTVGASASESVREIYVGSLEAFPTSAFPPADYIALGHIHRPQKVGGLEHIRYSGSPIALSFDEARQQKEVLLLTFEGATLQSITPLPVPVFQPMASLRGSLKELAGAIAEVAAQGMPERPVWLEVQVSTDDYLSDLQSRINALCEGHPVEVLRIRRERGNAMASLASEARETLDELSVEDVFSRRLQQETLEEEDAQRLQGLYRQVLEALPKA